jgi:succinate dehydrogenase / fumarate reductase membrane anchor subunit
MLQRISALYLGSFLVYLVVRLLLGQPLTAPAWHAWITHPVMRLASAGFILALLTHIWVGMRSIILDYIKPIGLRLVLLTLIGLVIGGCGLWALQLLMVTPG